MPADKENALVMITADRCFRVNRRKEQPSNMARPLSFQISVLVVLEVGGTTLALLHVRNNFVAG